MNTMTYTFDRQLLIVVMALLGLGLVMVGSASISTAASNMDNPLYYFNRQFIFAVIGFPEAGSSPKTLSPTLLLDVSRTTSTVL